MAVSVTVAGVSYTIPTVGDTSWGPQVTAWIQAISSVTLQSSGGNFTLTSDLNFGSSFGLIAKYFTSVSSSPASAGAIRLANGDSIKWRNAANSGDNALGVDSSDNLTWNSVILPTQTKASFQDSTFFLYDDADATKKVQFQLSGLTAATTRTLTIPDASTTLVGTDTTQTLTNKTLTSPTISSPATSNPTNTGLTTLSDTSADSPAIKEMLKISRSGGSNSAATQNRGGMISWQDASAQTYTAGIFGFRPDANNTWGGGLSLRVNYAGNGQATTVAGLTESMVLDQFGNVQVGTADGGTVHTCARFQVIATNHGFLMPVMPQTSRDSISSPTSGLGVHNTDTETPDYYDGAAAVWRHLVSRDKSETLSNKTLASPVITGTLAMDGSSSGAITFQTQAIAGTWNFNLPITAGSAGTVLTSQGGGSTAMTWSSVLTNPMSAAGDIIYSSDGSGTPARLAKGTDGNYLSLASGIPAWKAFTAPTVTTLTSTGTTAGYRFTITSGNATAGATYTNNGHTYTVIKTVAAATTVYMSGASAPTSSGTLTKATGTGDATLTFSANAALAAYTPPSTAKGLWVREVAGGGGGGGVATATSSSAAGGGGGGGGYAEKLIAAGSFDATMYYEIGVGGTAGSAGANAGGTGGQTTLVDSQNLIVCLGGAGGNGGTTASTPNPGAGGNVGGVASGGDINVKGSSGGTGSIYSGTTAISGAGGSTPLGGTVSGVVGTGTGNAGLAYGAGAGGAAQINNGGTQAGGVGGVGVMIIREIYNGN